MPPTRAASVSETVFHPDLTCPLVSSQSIAWLLARTNPDEPAPSLRFHYRSFITTTSRSAGMHRNGTQRLPVSAAQRTPSRTRRLNNGTRCCISTCLPTFCAEAADQAHAAATPDTAWPVDGHPPGSSRGRIDTPVLMSFPKSRHVISGSLAFVFLIPT